MTEYSLLAIAIVTADGTDAIDPRLVPGDSVSSEPDLTALHPNRYEEWRPGSDLYVVKAGTMSKGLHRFRYSFAPIGQPVFARGKRARRRVV